MTAGAGTEPRSWVREWSDAANAAELRARVTPCPRCGGVQRLGYSNLGIPLACCPTCSPGLAENGRRSVGEAWGL